MVLTNRENEFSEGFIYKREGRFKRSHPIQTHTLHSVVKYMRASDCKELLHPQV